MNDNDSTLEADLEYAEHMVRAGFWTPVLAAQTCSVPLADLQARLANPPRPRPTAQIKPFRFDP